MSELARKAALHWSRFKDVILLFYAAIMITMAFVVLMEVKLRFNLDIPYVDLPFDEWYQKCLGRF